MKTGNKILLLTIVVILALTVIVIVSMGIYISATALALGKSTDGKTRIITREFNLADFNSVRAGGAWELEIARADYFRVTVTAPEAVMEYIEPGIDSGNTLLVNQWFWADPRILQLQVSICMPELTSLEAGGNSSITFTGFACKSLDVLVQDAAKVTGSASAIGDLKVTGSGAAQLDLSACSVVNADCALAWTGKINLNINGGKISGTVSGVSEFDYTGNACEVDITAAGSVKIRKKQEKG